MLDMGLGSDDDRFQVVFEEKLDHHKMVDQVVDPEGNADEARKIDVKDENQVVVVGLAAVPNSEC